MPKYYVLPYPSVKLSCIQKKMYKQIEGKVVTDYQPFDYASQIYLDGKRYFVPNFCIGAK